MRPWQDLDLFRVKIVESRVGFTTTGDVSHCFKRKHKQKYFWLRNNRWQRNES